MFKVFLILYTSDVVTFIVWMFM